MSLILRFLPDNVVLSEHEQGSEGWLAVRAGKGTASKGDCIAATGKTKGVEATTRRNYRVQVVTERLTGVPQEDDYQSKDMAEGKELEKWARAAYEEATGLIAHQVGFLHFKSIPAGCSPDGVVEDPVEGFGFTELKCPKSATHIDYLLRGRLPPEYLKQVLHTFWVLSTAKFCDFASYDQRLPEKLRLFRVRVYRHEIEVNLANYVIECMTFLAEVSVLEQQLRKRAA